MRGGAIPLIAWGTLLLVLFIGNWIWDARGVNPAAAGLAALIIYLAALLLWIARRDSVRRGPPEPRQDPEALPEESLGAALAGFSLATILFGLVWGRFLVVFGVALLVASLARTVLEWRAERRTRHQAEEPRQ
ncbi:MAG: hypothetical protein JOZ73_06600 [Solirubrobacterales bacterium]|nr:hypothetical protein [Solirubrobacterales bacterium]